MRTEAAIIGAGPAGLLAAAQISKCGYKTIVFEEHPEIGEPNHCAGLISIEGFGRLGIEPSIDFIQNSIYGCKVFSPDSECLVAKDKRIRAYVIDRSSFDQYLAEKALDSGTEFEKGTKVNELKQIKGFFTKIDSTKGEIISNLIIDGEGAHRSLLRKVGLVQKQQGMLTGLNVEIGGLSLDPELVEVWFGEKLAKGLFAWVIPISENDARVGLATSTNDALYKLKNFVKKRFNISRISGAKIGKVHTGGPIKKTVWPGLLVIGDAAGHTKPTTGGGVVFGGLCAKIAGNVAVQALKAEDYSIKTLSIYEHEWRNMCQREFRAMLALRKLLNELSDERFNRIFQSVKYSGLSSAFIELIEEGDMDFQSEILKKALLNPRILSLLAQSVGKLAITELLSLFKPSINTI